MSVPSSIPYVIIGGGIHGLSTAYHLALQLKASGRGDGRDIVVLEKSAIGAGPSGIACGVVRNNYYQPAMRQLMAHCVEVWESDPQAFSYHPVGYMQISPEVMHEQVATIARQQKDIGYTSVFIEGEADCLQYMKGLFHDWQARGITSVLHEKKGGYANNIASLRGLAAKAESQGVRILAPVQVTGFRYSGNAVDAVVTDQGVIETSYVIAGVGPWVKTLWEMLDLPKFIRIKGRDGTMHDKVHMWTFMCLEEGTLGVDPSMQKTNDGTMPPVIHVDADAPLYSDIDGSLITDKLWGIYYKPDFCFNGVQGGAMPYRIEKNADEVKIDPYGPQSREFITRDSFPAMWCSALAFCQKRFEGKYPLYKKEASGGLGSFTPDNFPVFDVFHQNCYIIADSNHGYKMIGVGSLVAKEIVSGRKSELLEPFRFSRYQQGKLHPVSNSPFPWS